MRVYVKVYDNQKYSIDRKLVVTDDYEISGFEVKEIADEEMLKMGFESVDPLGEYLILKKNGEEIIFRNSYCDLFKY